MKTVLAIDGGGIRGIIPALILAEIEKCTGRNISDLFDMIVGTSTGGILALGLVKPNNLKKPQYTAAELAKLYEEESERIFDKQFMHFELRGLFEERYSNEGIETVLEEYFGDSRFSDSLTDVIVTSYEIESRTPYFFKHFKMQLPNYTNQNGDVFMKDIARATSAAPTFFEPKKILSGSESLALIDGGIFSNNPAMCAYVEAKTRYPEQEDLVVVSLGTGEQTGSIKYEEAKKWGVVNWAPAILDIVFDGVSKTVDYQLRKLLPLQEGIERYYRFQDPLTKPDDDLDNITKENIEKLKKMAYQMIKDDQTKINSLCKVLLKAKKQVSL
ncbi:CBASS cGAMP-activated phospholipase [Planococcus sp. 1R117A]|uniref:CBASS cGAMP-activated phospholipase n=1 Tax=Planococcus sp. 1R117A TaxID=3447020 RepID=UPI003EDC4803